MRKVLLYLFWGKVVWLSYYVKKASDFFAWKNASNLALRVNYVAMAKQWAIEDYRVDWFIEQLEIRRIARCMKKGVLP